MTSECQARAALWNNVVNVRFRAFYFERVSTWVSRCDTTLNISLALVTTGSVGAWLKSADNARVCAVVICGTQLASVFKKYLPWLKQSSQFGSCALAYSKLFITAEQAWRECERCKEDSVYEKALTKLRESEHKVESQYRELPVGEVSFIYNWAYQKMMEFFQLNFPS